MSPRTGRAIQLEAPEELVAAEYPLPSELDPEGVLVRTTLATVCGSDVHSWRGRRPFPTPSILGHEIVGDVVKLGNDIDRDTAGRPLAPGDRILWTIAASCGRCYHCRVKGLPQKCEHLFKYGHGQSDEPPHFDGGFAEYVYLRPGTSVFRIPETIPSAVASPLMCAGATIAAGIDEIGIDVMDDVVVQGAGLLGLYGIALAKEHGARQVIAIDLDEDRLTTAASFGADMTLQAGEMSDQELVATVREATDGRGADVAIEVAGAPQVIPVGVELLATAGRYLLHGSLYPEDEFELDGHDVITKQLTIRGVHNYDASHLRTIVGFVANRLDRYPFEEITGPTYPLTVRGATRAMTALEEREAIRPAIVPE